MKSKYNIGDRVRISRMLSSDGQWRQVDSLTAKIVDIKPTVSLGIAYTLEVSGERLHVCYWESDIDGRAND